MDREDEIKKYRQKIGDLVNREGIISGIHNYCDRWCEKCMFTSRCSVFVIEKEMDWDQDIQDLKNEKFWNRMSMIFAATIDMLTESAKEMGIDLDDVESCEFQEPKSKKESKTEKQAKEYSYKLLDWLKSKNEFFEEKIKILAAMNENQVVTFADAIEVIHWYSFFITAKTHRAFYNIDPEFTDDSLGSAKIAVIGITRSMEAFSVLYQQLPEDEDEILHFLSSLSKIKRGILQQFPETMEFKRPGFDD